MRVGLVSLGCPKNQVDAEMILASLRWDGAEIVDCTDGADVVIINTCAFIDDAKKEAIDSILDMAELKKEGVVGKIIVTGCLSQAHGSDILKEMPEVDAVVGIGANSRIADIVKSVAGGETVFDCPDVSCMCLEGQRLLTTPEYWAYLRISDGCSNKCSYCAIPGMRGGLRSRKIETIVEEARQLAAAGTKEIVLIAQDTTAYGRDIYGEHKLPALLNKLCSVSGIEWIRLLYCYPDEVTDELIDVMEFQPKVLKYIDLPLQHADDKILKAMNRRGSQADIRSLVGKLRRRIPGIVIRTTLITGFPGEGEDEFERLAVFVNELEFDRLGCFVFSPQEGTAAFSLPGDVDEETKIRRREIIMEDQLRIVEEKNLKKIGTAFKVLVEEYDAYTDSYTGRTYMDAPEIDGFVTFTSQKTFNPGDFADVVITGCRDYDLLGRAK